MENIKSKLAVYSVFIGMVMSIFLAPAGVICIYKIIDKLFLSGVDIVGIFALLLFIGIFLLLLNFLKTIRYIIVKDDKLTYYSVLRPFGKTLYFKDYIGKIIVQERGSGGAYNVIYFIDENNRTVFKITGVHYNNFDEINKAIPLEVINFNPTVKEYYKLLFFGRITLKKSSINKGENKKLNKILLATQIIVVIGMLLMIIRYALGWA